MRRLVFTRFSGRVIGLVLVLALGQVFVPGVAGANHVTVHDRSNTIFSDNFNGENGGSGTTVYSGFAQWTVTDGSVDLIGEGFFDFYPGNGLYVDLDGSTREAGVMSTAPLSLSRGPHTLRFDLGGSQRSDDNVVTVQLGNEYLEDITVLADQSLTTWRRSIWVGTTGMYVLSVSNAGGDDVGAVLDNVTLHYTTSCDAPPTGYNPVPGTSAGETLNGTTGNDIICGEGGNDKLNGRGGDDILLGGEGNDILTPGTGNDSTVNGGNGTDTVSYADITAGGGQDVNLANHTSVGGGGTDAPTAIENVIGSPQADTLSGDSGKNNVAGKGGNDDIFGQGGNDTILPGTGNDSINAGDGVDILSYADITAGGGQDVNLTTGSSFGGGGTDFFVAFENVVGSPQSDNLTGSAVRNVLTGGTGGDSMNGAAGNDVVNGKDLITGNDSLDCGTGTDTFTADAGDSVVNCP